MLGLPRRCQPYADEPLLGFAARISAANKIPYTYLVLMRSGLPHSSAEAAAFQTFPLKTLSRHTGVRSSVLQQMSYWPRRGDALATFQGKPIAPDALSVQRRRACPKCLAEAPYHRASWDLAFSVACIRHSVRLIQDCSHCRAPLGWRQSNLLKCRCGRDLRKQKAEKLPASALSGARQLDDLMRGAGPLVSVQRASGMSPGDFAKWVCTLGWFAAGNRRRPRLIKELARPKRLLRAINAGVAMLDGWPSRFHDFLDDVRRASSKRRGRYGVTYGLGAVGQWLLASDVPRSVENFSRRALQDYVAERPDFRFRTRRIRNPSQLYCTLTEAKRLLRRSVVRVRVILARHHLLSLDGHRGKGAPLLVRRATVEAVRAELFGLVDKTGVRAILGCRKAVLWKWMRVLPPPASGVAADLMGRTCWHRADIEAFVGRVGGIVDGRGMGRAVIPLPLAISRFDAGGTKLGAILDTLLYGEVLPGRVLNGKRGLSAIGVDPKAFQERIVGRNTVSLPDAAVALGIKQETAYLLAGRGLLKTCHLPPLPGRRVTLYALEDCRSALVFPGQLRLDSGHYPGWTSDQFIGAGLRPVSGRGVDGGRYFVFARIDVERMTVVKSKDSFWKGVKEFLDMH